ncbi:MAG: hypothetical protein JXQ74_02725 [Alphaproteobacteria bacterium]|nr:hypothetical protein [Alphaproteobacteria bacterium]
MMRLTLVLIGFLALSLPVSAQTDPFVLQMQMQAVQNNINALKAENAALQVELEDLETTLKKKKTGAGVAIGAGVLGGGFGAFGIYKGAKAQGDYKNAKSDLKALENKSEK